VAAVMMTVVYVIKPAQKAHSAWLPKILRNWCADSARGRPGENGSDCQ
jgi:hypothetical protein